MNTAGNLVIQWAQWMLHAGWQAAVVAIAAMIQRTTIECNRVQEHSLDPSLKLMYPALVTDNEGRIRVPVYDTVFRANEYSWPAGYHLEATETLGWFKSKTHTGVLPDLLVWVPYSRPEDFTRTAAETKLLKDAAGTLTQEITSDDNTYVLESVARANQDATFVRENGRGVAVASPTRELPDLENAAWMDHAVIDLKVPDPEQFDIQSTIVKTFGCLRDVASWMKLFR